MKTEDLINVLSLDAGPRPSVPGRLAFIAGLGACAAFALLAAWLGFRPDIGHAVTTPMFWMKAGYTLALGLAGYGCAERLSRPIGSPRRAVMLALALFVLVAGLGFWQFMRAAPDDQMPMLMGKSWRVCPRNIIALSLPSLAVALVVVRGLAPTRLALAGAAAGLFAGGVAATIYGLHCPEHSLVFVAVWYSLGVGLVAALGAALGPWALRWR